MSDNKKPETTHAYITRYRTLYARIGAVQCEPLGFRVAFTMVGFKHLVYKGNRRRPKHIFKSRLKLIPLAVPVLKNAIEVVETRIKKEEHYGQRCDVRYDALEAVVSKSNIRVRVIVRTIGKQGTPHFFSIMRY